MGYSKGTGLLFFDFRPVQTLYDQLLWEIVTSSTDELRKLGDRIFEEPYNDLPTPIVVTLCRILSTELAPNQDLMEHFAASAAPFCSPEEELGFRSGQKQIEQILPGSGLSNADGIDS